MDESDAIEDAVRYTEIETEAEVVDIELDSKFTHWTDDHFVFVVETAEPDQEWWVVSGQTLTNLYPKEQFPIGDYVFSFHLGISYRLLEDEVRTAGTLGDMNYDIFVCHASEDKAEFADPLANYLDEMGLHVWYDDFRLDVGDSLRESIDEGLSNSHFGTVILSEAFFEKNWTQYELNGLTAREMQDESLILPIWYQIDNEDVLDYSPSLADKLAIVTDGSNIKEVARELSDAMESTLMDRAYDKRIREE